MIYTDTSFLVAAYVVDSHSPTVVNRLATKPQICITPFTRCEVANAVFRQAFLGKLTPTESLRAWGRFESDCRVGAWDCREFSPRAWEICIDLAIRYGPTLGVRTLDSLHVACALELNAQKFWTFDDRQAKLANAVGLDTTP